MIVLEIPGKQSGTLDNASVELANSPPGGTKDHGMEVRWYGEQRTAPCLNLSRRCAYSNAIELTKQ